MSIGTHDKGIDMKPIYLEADNPICNVGRKAFPGYNGRKFKLIISDGPIDVRSYWDGGSRDYFRFINLENGKMSDNVPAQHPVFDQKIDGANKVKLPIGVACVKHSIFCGKDAGLSIHINPENAAKLLPNQEDITENEKTVLEYTSRYKNSYSGQTNIRYKEAKRDNKIDSQEKWDFAKQSLIEKGFLKKNGSITPKGRNAI